jgi:predicted secreted hydrolase
MMRVPAARRSPRLGPRLVVLLLVGVLAGLDHSVAQEATPFVETAPELNDAPIPVEFPRDDGPHAAFIEWWYYTGHLFTAAGDRYGFEFVVFKGERDGLVGFAAHFAITDTVRGEFRYAERAAVGAENSTEVPGGGFDLRVAEWRMSGAGGEDRLVAQMDGYAISLKTTSPKPPALHDGDGYIDYGVEGQASYYYSRTRLTVSGSLRVDETVMEVDGEAWMDHQWGDFRTYEEGGWDWFALQLDDGWDLMLYVIRAPDGSPAIVDGSLIDPAGNLTVLDREDFVATPLSAWTSPATGVVYPSGWVVELPAAELTLTLTPALLDQELDTTASTGQIYWEGEVEIEGTRAGQPVGGLGYVELTGYASRQATALAA